MRKNLISGLLSLLCVFVLASFAFAQDERAAAIAAGQKYVISAKAGNVNTVEGNVTVARAGGKSGLLLSTDALAVGDQVSTGSNGKAEILLNPGSFVRLAGNSKFGFDSIDLEDLKLKLISGSAIFEIYASDDLKVQVQLPSAKVEFTNSGVFRIDVLPDGSGKVSVWKGRFLIGGDDDGVKSGRTVTIGAGVSAITKFDRDNRDELDIWSQLRGKEAAMINDNLRRDRLRNSLMESHVFGEWNIFNPLLGVWFYDQKLLRWCFLPFGSGWRSPYGFAYRFDIYDCGLPTRIFIQPPVVTPTGQTNSDIRAQRSERSRTPTFQRFESTQRVVRGGGGGGGVGNMDDNGNGSGTGIWTSDRQKNDQRDTKPNSSPSINTPTQSAPIIVMPTRQDTKEVKDN